MATQQHKWTLDELDLSQQLVTLESLIPHKQLLVEKLFTILSKNEIISMLPDNLKNIPLDILKDIVIIELKDNAIASDEEMMTVINSIDKPKIEEVVQEQEEGPKQDIDIPKSQEKEKTKFVDSDSDNQLSKKMGQDIKRSLKEKYKFSNEELDISKPLTPLIDLIKEPRKLIETAFSLMSEEEIKEIKPSNLQDIKLTDIIDSCVQMMESLPLSHILSSLAENRPLPTDTKKVEEMNDDGRQRKGSTGTTHSDENNEPPRKRSRSSGRNSREDNEDIEAELDESRREIEELEAKAKVLRSLLSALGEHVDDNPGGDNSGVDQVQSERQAHPIKEDIEGKEGQELPSESDNLLIQLRTRVRDEDEDSLDRELKGNEEEGRVVD